MQEIKKNCPINEKQLFIQKVFGNIEAILDFSLVLSNSFKKRQTLDPIIKEIGDIFLQHVFFFFLPVFTFSFSFSFSKFKLPTLFRLMP